MIMHTIVIRPLTSYPYKAWTEHAGFSSDHARTPSTSAKRRGVFDRRMKGGLHPSNIIRPKAYRLSCTDDSLQ